ncbi:hypothetical protein HK102_008262, partial [Quaeritorhiza haematococci]
SHTTHVDTHPSREEREAENPNRGQWIKDYADQVVVPEEVVTHEGKIGVHTAGHGKEYGHGLAKERPIVGMLEKDWEKKVEDEKRRGGGGAVGGGEVQSAEVQQRDVDVKEVDAKQKED